MRLLTPLLVVLTGSFLILGTLSASAREVVTDPVGGIEATDEDKKKPDKPFKTYPKGTYRQESVTFHDGRQIGGPVSVVICGDPLDPNLKQATKEMHETRPDPCTKKIIMEKEDFFQYDFSCPYKGGEILSHITARAVDDTHLTMETNSTGPGMPAMKMRVSMTYLNSSCSKDYQQVTKIPHLDCKRMAAIKARIPKNTCDGKPAAMKAQCEAQMQAGLKAMEQNCQ